MDNKKFKLTIPLNPEDPKGDYNKLTNRFDCILPDASRKVYELDTEKVFPMPLVEFDLTAHSESSILPLVEKMLKQNERKHAYFSSIKKEATESVEELHPNEISPLSKRYPNLEFRFTIRGECYDAEDKEEEFKDLSEKIKDGQECAFYIGYPPYRAIFAPLVGPSGISRYEFHGFEEIHSIEEAKEYLRGVHETLVSAGLFEKVSSIEINGVSLTKEEFLSLIGDEPMSGNLSHDLERSDEGPSSPPGGGMSRQLITNLVQEQKHEEKAAEEEEEEDDRGLQY